MPDSNSPVRATMCYLFFSFSIPSFFLFFIFIFFLFFETNSGESNLCLVFSGQAF